jgi:hypothetical protein
MANLACQDWAALDGYGNDAITEAAGASAHEVKTWVAANAAMNAATGGHYPPSPAITGRSPNGSPASQRSPVPRPAPEPQHRTPNQRRQQ